MGKLTSAGAAAAWLALASTSATARAAISEPAFTETVHLQPRGTAGTSVMAWAPDGSNRLFYGRQQGQLWLVIEGYLTGLANVSPVYSSGECGVLGLAFDPNFLMNHYLYAFVTVSASEQQIIRYEVGDTTISNKTVVIAGLPTRGAGHNAGSIGFGPDGKLYWAIGDLADRSGESQDLTTLTAKLARVNLDGSAPADNPFFDGDGPNEDRIWALGFRNPFTFTWRPGTEEMWVNTVGLRHEQIFVPHAGDNAGWPSYENNQPDGYLEPILSYPKAQPPLAMAANGAHRADGVATFTTLGPHGLHLGTRVTIADSADASFDGVAYVTAIPSAVTFSVAQAGPDAESGLGSAAAIDLGDCITGGAFWDSSSVPASYRGNFFFGDCTSSQIGRVTFSDDRVTSLDSWGVGAGVMIDMAVGPDGDLYYTTFQGGVYRIHYNATAQGIVVSSLHVRAPEGGRAVFSVHLAMAPSEPVTVAIERTAGDADVEPEESELSFDGANWATPQAVVVAAAEDEDAAEDLTELTLSAEGLADESVEVRVTDDDALALLAAPAELSLTPGSSAKVSVVLNGKPSRPVDVAVTLTPDSQLAVSPASFTFTPQNWLQPQPLTLSAPIPGPPLDVAEQLSLTGDLLLSAEVTATLVAATEERAENAGMSAGGAPQRDPPQGGQGGIAGGEDAAPMSDAGSPNAQSENAGAGCGCRVPRSASPWHHACVAMLATALLMLRRRRAHG